jgi:MoaA/NifB/PqqE/SkfB family radical SAM enzyme
MNISGPLDLTIEVISACNLHCDYCYALPATRGKPPTKDEFATMLKKIFKSFHPFKVTLTGGEPFLRNDILDLAEMVNKYECEVAIVSNGTKITAERAFDVKKAQDEYGLGIQISLDSHIPEINDRVRGRYHEAVRGMNYLKDTDAYFSVGIVVHRQNATGIVETLEWLYEQGYPAAHLMNIMPTAEYQKNFHKLHLDEPQFQDVWRKVLKFKEMMKGKFDISTPYDFHTERKREAQAFRREKCLGGVTRAQILQNGDLVPCDIARSIVYGNVFQDNWEQIWTSPETDIYRNSDIPQCLLSIRRYGLQGPSLSAADVME